MLEKIKDPVILMRLAALWLLFLGLGHSIGFAMMAGDPGAFEGARAVAYEAMTARDMGSRTGATMWTAYVMFSLGHGFLMLFAGLATWMVAGGSDAALRYNFTRFLTVFWIGAAVVWFWRAPIESPVLILFGTLPPLLLAWFFQRK